MELFDYLETATRGFSSNAKAREVRLELLAHITFLKERFQQEGQDETAALQQALSQMGDVDALARQLTTSADIRSLVCQSLLGLGAVIAAIFTMVWTPMLLGLLVCALGFAFVRNRHESMAYCKSELRSRALALKAILGLTLVIGFAAGAWPLLTVWLPALEDPWGGLRIVLIPLVFIAAAILIFRTAYKEPQSIGLMMGLGSLAVGALGSLSSLLLWRLYPVPLLGGGSWFINIAGASFTGTAAQWARFPAGAPWFSENVIYRPAIVTALWFLLSFSAGAVALLSLRVKDLVFASRAKGLHADG